ncbi:MAG: hypothetical protein ACJA06_001984, partial [Halocynthiibacter sp.]
MRLAYFAAFAALPFSAFADDFVLNAPITAVEVYPQGAKVTREVPYNIPAGSHRLILPDLPAYIPASMINATLSNGGFSTEQVQTHSLPPIRLPESDEIKAARTELKAVEDAIIAFQLEVDAATAEIEAGKALQAFAAGLGQGQGDPLTPEALSDIAVIVAEKTAQAAKQIAAAQAKISAMERDAFDLENDEERARTKLESLVPDDESRTQFTGAINASGAISGVMTIEYYISSASWQPVYSVYLTRGDKPEMKIDRTIALTQDTGESWRDVDLMLTTRELDSAVDGQLPSPWLRRIMEPVELKARSAVPMSMEDSSRGYVEPVMEEAPVIVQQIGEGVSYGLDMVYKFPQKISAPSARAATLLELDTLSFDAPEIRAIAYAASNDRAFAQATFKNTSGEALLAGASRHFLDGVLVGTSALGEIAAGAEADIGFGAIRGIQLKRITKGREEGDSGVIRRSNDETDAVVITVENLTGEPWDLRLMDRVPYSEQEDLSIKWQASPMPSAQDIDGK